MGCCCTSWSATTSEVVTTERVGPALVARIEREPSGNAISREVVAGLAEGVREAEAAAEVHGPIEIGRLSFATMIER